MKSLKFIRKNYFLHISEDVTLSMSIGKKLTIGLLAAIIVIGAGGYFKITSDRSKEDSTVATQNKDFIKVNDTKLSLKDGKTKLKITLAANTSVKVTGKDEVIDAIEWPTASNERHYMLVLKNNGTYYVEARRGSEFKKIKVIVGDGVFGDGETSSSEASSIDAEISSVETVSSSVVTPVYTPRESVVQPSTEEVTTVPETTSTTTNNTTTNTTTSDSGINTNNAAQ